MSRIAARVALRFLRLAAPLEDVSKLRYQAVFLMGAGGSGKGFVGRKWLKYMPGGSSKGIDFDSSSGKKLLQRKLTEQERGQTNLDFEKAKRALAERGIRIDLTPQGASVPFRLYTYEAEGDAILLRPDEWKTKLPADVYRQVKGLTSVIFSAPVHEVPSYWRQVNPDLYKEELAGYLEKEPGYVHEMSSEMSKAYFEAALGSGDPIFIDGTGANPDKMETQIKAAKKAGYRVSLVLVIVPLTVNQIRNATRARNVDPNIITKQWKKIRDNFASLRSVANKAKVIINRNDSADVSAYKAKATAINDFIRRTTAYDSLHDLIAKENPSELSDWGALLKSQT